MIDMLDNLHFIRPGILFLLPLFWLGLIFCLRSNNASSGWKKSIDPDLLPYLINNHNEQTRSLKSLLPSWLAILFITIACVAAAGPSFEKLPQPPIKQQQTLIVIADLTLSMHAEDIKPSRLVRMRYKLLELLKQRREGQTALIAYSGDAHIVSPLTDDSTTISALVPALSPEIMPQIGSNAGAAFTLAKRLMESGAGRNTLVWFTDGFNNTDVAAMKNLLSKHSVNLIIIGVGTENGAPVRLPSGKFLKNSNQQIVKPGLNSSQFKQLAQQLGARYIPLQSDNSDINFILADRFEIKNNLNVVEEAGYEFDQWLDRGAWLLLFVAPFAALAFRRGWLVSLVLLLTSLPSNELLANENENLKQSEPSLWQRLWHTADQRGARYYRDGDYEKAQSHFENQSWKGISAYQNKNFKAAEQTFRQSIEANKQTDPQTSANAYYNHGHALAQAGNLPKAISAYDKALALNPDFEQARQARQIVEALLNEQRAQQDQHSQQQPEQNQPEQNQQSNTEKSEQQSNQQESPQNGQQSDSMQQKDDSATESDQLKPEQFSPEQQADNKQSSIDNQQDELASDDNNEAQAKNPMPENLEQKKEGDQQHNLTMINPDGKPMDPEQAAALEQWLNKIEDDPAGLLRRKFQYQQQLRERKGDVVKPDKEGNIW